MVNKTSKTHKSVKSRKSSKVKTVGSKKNSKATIPVERIPIKPPEKK